MTVYVDDMEAKYGRMKMFHMVADSDAELRAMAARIGVARKWHQKPGTPRSHYDICLSKKAQALAANAVPITWKQASAMTARRRETGEMGKPEDAIAWLHAFNAEKRKAAAKAAAGAPIEAEGKPLTQPAEQLALFETP